MAGFLRRQRDDDEICRGVEEGAQRQLETHPAGQKRRSRHRRACRIRALRAGRADREVDAVVGTNLARRSRFGRDERDRGDGEGRLDPVDGQPPAARRVVARLNLVRDLSRAV